MPKQGPHIFVATPCYGGLVAQRYMPCVFALLQRGTERGFSVSLQMLGYESLITRGRNTLVLMFLDHPYAIRKMIKAYPETRYTAAHNFTRGPASKNLYALLGCIIKPETRHYLSEDYTFCKRLRAISGKVWLNTNSSLIHIGAHEFHGNPPARHAGMETVQMRAPDHQILRAA